MESLSNDILLEFNPDTLESVRKEFNLDKPGRVNEAIDILDDWVKKQPHFKKKDFTRDYLERTIISCKGLIERSKIRMDKLCTYKTMLPKFFKNTDAKECSELQKFVINSHLPKLTPDNYRVYFMKMVVTGESNINYISSFYKYTIMLSEYLKNHEYANGLTVIVDFTDVNVMSFVPTLNVVELHQTLTLLMDGYGMRLKGLHVVTPSKAVTALVSILKQVLSEKLGSRVYSHKTIESVYEHVPKNILPAEYGGEERSLKQLNEEWLRVLNSEQFKEYLEEMNEAKTLEDCRQANKLTEQYIGIPGSFRSLSVD